MTAEEIKKRLIILLWGILFLMVVFTWPITVVPLWILTRFNLFTYLTERINKLIENQQP